MLTLEGYIRVRLNGLVSRQGKNKPVTLTESWIINTLKEQNFACAATHVALSFDPTLGPRSLSFDRKDGTKGYTPENVMLVSYMYNNCKNRFDHADVVLFAKNVLGIK